MIRSVFAKTLYDKRGFIVGWSLALAGFAALLVVFYPAMRQDGALDELAKTMPPAFQGLVGNLADLSQFDTYIASQLFDIRLPLLAGIMALILGLGLSVSDEERGELRTLLSLPISRTKLFIQRWLAMATILLLTIIGLLIGMYASMPFVDGATIEPAVLIRLVGMTGLMMVAFGTIPFAVGIASGKRALATAVGIGVVMGSFILSTFGSAVGWLQGFETFSLLHYFPAVDIVKTGISMGDVYALTGVTTVLLLMALLLFRTRDVA